MNEPLKLKWHSLYGQVLQERNLIFAFSKVRSNGGVGGIDNVSIEEFESNLMKNIEELQTELKAKEYKPAPVRRVYIPKKNGGKRPLGIPIIKDRVVQQTLVDILSPKFENGIFHKCSCGYRPNYGMEKTMQLILWHIENGNNHIFDCDIKGFFDNIPHKKLMKILNKYIADGTVLSLIWSWLKSGYMEEGKYLDTKSGTPQGGVISPLLANIYLNELDWELEKAGIKFVRYADDFLLFANSELEIQRAGLIAKQVIESLGLEVAMNKTKFVDFEKDDFNFVGFTFKHWRENKKTGQRYFVVEPTEKSLKDFKKKVKDKTRKTLTLSQEVWFNQVNPIIRGKVNYYLVPFNAVKLNEEKGQKSHCYIKGIGVKLHSIDSYTRQRLRVCMQHGHTGVRRGFLMTRKWNIEYFCRAGLISANWYYFNKVYGYTIDQYIEKQTTKNKENNKRYQQKLKDKGIEYFTKDRYRKIANTNRFAIQ